MKKITIEYSLKGDRIILNIPELDHSWNFPNMPKNAEVVIRNISKILGEYIESKI